MNPLLFLLLSGSSIFVYATTIAICCAFRSREDRIRKMITNSTTTSPFD